MEIIPIDYGLMEIEGNRKIVSLTIHITSTCDPFRQKIHERLIKKAKIRVVHKNK